MVGDSIRQYGVIERGVPWLFLVGGGLIVGHAAIRGIHAFTEISPPPDLFGPPGYLVALLGMFGLYPALVDRTPTLARAAALVALVPLAGWIVISAVTMASVAGILSAHGAVLPGSFYVVHLVVVILTYLLFGISSLRAGVHSRTVSVLLLAPALLFVALLSGAVLVGDSAVGSFVIGGGQALAHLSIGGILYARLPNDSRIPDRDIAGG